MRRYDIHNRCLSLMVLIIGFALFASVEHSRWILSVSSTTPKSHWWLTLQRGSPFSWYCALLYFACRRCSLRMTHFSVLKLMRPPWDQIDRESTSFCRLWTSDILSIVLHIFTSSASITASNEKQKRTNEKQNKRLKILLFSKIKRLLTYLLKSHFQNDAAKAKQS